MTTVIRTRSFNILANDDYTLNTLVPDSDRKQTVVMQFTRNGAYDGTFLVQARPRGSSLAYQTVAYVLLGTGATQASALGAADAEIRLDSTGLELRLLSSARTTGSVDCYVTDAPES